MAVADFSVQAGSLLTPGDTGDLYAGFSGSDNPPVLIGQYTVVPEAGTGTFVLLGGSILLLARRYRARLA